MDSHQRAPGEAWAAGSTEDCFWKTLISSLEMSVFSRDLHFLRTLRACGMAGGPVGPEGEAEVQLHRPQGGLQKPVGPYVLR